MFSCGGFCFNLSYNKFLFSRIIIFKNNYNNHYVFTIEIIMKKEKERETGTEEREKERTCNGLPF